MMNVRNIRFSGPMVRALLDGRKTQTRRVLTIPRDYSHAVVSRRGSDGPRYVQLTPSSDYVSARQAPRTCATGDLLWVREAWRTPESLDHLSPKQIEARCKELGYHGPWCPRVTEADNHAHQWLGGDGFREGEPVGRFRASMHMPRWASRITLNVTDVRVQRLQEISEADAKAEGIRPLPMQSETDSSAWWESDYGENQARTPVASFRKLWNSLNDKRDNGWDTNPLVIAVSFEVIKANVDTVLSEVAA
ncbi:PmgT [Roseibium sp. TrichSKD4]|nr:PmgT [Roseibium sp. TrichSKD4]